MTIVDNPFVLASRVDVAHEAFKATADYRTQLVERLSMDKGFAFVT